MKNIVLGVTGGIAAYKACDLVSIGLKTRLQSVVTRELRALRVERALNSTLQTATEYKRQLKDHMKSSSSSTCRS